MMNIISLEKLFATFDAVIGLGWSELSEDDYIRYLKDYSIILEDDAPNVITATFDDFTPPLARK